MMFKVETWICTTLFAFGIIVGMTYLNLSGYTLTGRSVDRSAESKKLADELKRNAESEKRQLYERLLIDDDLAKQDTVRENELLELADRYLAAGNYALALENYHAYRQRVANSGSAIMLRQAICCEMQERLSVAEEKYYEAVTKAAHESHRLLGFAGLARCLAKSGKRTEALDMLAELNLKLDLYKGLPEEVRAPIVFQFGKVLESFAIGDANDLTNPSTLAFDDSLPNPEIFLHAVDQPSQPPIVRAESTELKFEVLQRPAHSLNVISVSISGKLQPVPILVGQIAANSDLTPVISQLAQSKIANRARTVELQATPLSSVLDHLLVPFDLVWYQTDSELRILSRQEMDATALQFWFDAANRAFRRYELSFNEGPQRHASLLSRANLSLIQNRLDEASNLYQELTLAQPTDEILAKLFFNKAKLSKRLDQPENANGFLFLAVDQTMNPDIQASGYCLLGSNFLSQGELEASIKVSRRGLATAINQRQKQLTSLNLSRAYILKDDPFMANKVLFDNRQYYDGSSSEKVASILGSYARYIGVRDEFGIRNAQIRLMTAVTTVPDSEYQSFADPYITGLALERLGFRELAVNKLLLALTQEDVGQWKRQILFELGLLQKRLQNLSDAAASFQAVVQPDGDHWSQLALSELASAYLEANQPQPCIDACKQLWAWPLDESQKSRVLQLLGDAFQMKGEHHTAALCFAGMMPDRF